MLSADMSRRSPVVLLVTVVFFLAGLWILNLQAQQARDTRRKLDLADLEIALLRSLATTGTLPPENAPSWCGVLGTPEHAAIRTAIEGLLRETGAYRNPAKPFPSDPRWRGTPRDYAYAKTSPVSFELLAELEADRNDSRPLADCGTDTAYDYGIASLARHPL